MTMTRWVVRHRRRAALLAAGVALFASGLTASGLPSGVASAAPAQAAGFDRCPEAFPVAELEPGMEATGLTVERGTTPDGFTATVIGVLEDGVAAGVDMIIVETDSPAIQRASGIWAGMSGSPVYAEDGRLIGAVAYSLGIPSPIAGVTPAADMQTLLTRSGSVPSASPAATVQLPSRLRERVVASGAATVAEAATGLRQLPMPLGISGVGQAHLDEAAARLEQKVPGTRVHAASAAPIDRPGSASSIVPGGNFATAISYGEITVSGVGTTTAVCTSRQGGRQVLAFGHPLGWLGATTLSVHPAAAVYVQPDALLGPSKLANVGGVIGTLDQDRLVGIRGVLGPRPRAAELTSSFESEDDGTSRSATTRVNAQDFVPAIAADHVMGSFDRVGDRIGPGTAELVWLITGTRPSGETFTVEAANQYVDQVDISSMTPTDLATQLDALHHNRFEDIEITGVELTGSVTSEIRQYTLEEVLVRGPDGTYEPAPADAPLPVAPGDTLALRAVLTPYQGHGEVHEVDLALEVPEDAPAGFGEALVLGGPDPAAIPAAPTSFEALVEQLEGLTPNNAVTATLALEAVPPADTPSDRAVVDQPVTGSISVPVEVGEAAAL